MVGDLRVIVSDQSFFFNNKSSGGGCEYKLLTFLRCFPSNMLEGGAEGSPETSVQWRKAKGGGHSIVRRSAGDCVPDMVAFSVFTDDPFTIAG